jgi:hypothetical protein
MPTTVAGDPNNYPTSITIPSDGDGPGIQAADVNVAFEALADRTAYLFDHPPNPPYFESTTITATGSIVVPTGATHCFYSGCGGGGGGAGGVQAVGTDRNGTGGGGGGGALRCTGVLQVVAGETLNIAIGAAGTSGNGGVSNGLAAGGGGHGGDTTITRATGSVLLATLKGGRGGAPGLYAGAGGPDDTPATVTFNGVSTDYYAFAAGGEPVAKSNWRRGVKSLDHTALQSDTPQAGGRGTGARTPGTSEISGNAGPHGFSGGTGGTIGTASTTYLGGGPGGGGGAGPYGNGATGGTGGTANAAGNATNGGTGSSASANTGAGGGGGGASGSSVNSGMTGAGTGGAGGAGGSGRLTLTFLRLA